MICNCGGTYRHFDELNEQVFPVGMMTIKHDGWKCDKCHRLEYNASLSDLRIKEYRKRVDELLRSLYPFEIGIWIDLNRFSEMTGYGIGFIKDNLDFFTTMVFSIVQNGQIWFLNKSVVKYIHEDDGRFKLADYESNPLSMHYGCPVCGVGDVDGQGFCTCCKSKIGEMSIWNTKMK